MVFLCHIIILSQRGLEAQTISEQNPIQQQTETKKTIKSLIGSQFSAQVPPQRTARAPSFSSHSLLFSSLHL